jgi:hypothetical protein
MPYNAVVESDSETVQWSGRIAPLMLAISGFDTKRVDNRCGRGARRVSSFMEHYPCAHPTKGADRRIAPWLTTEPLTHPNVAARNCGIFRA